MGAFEANFDQKTSLQVHGYKTDGPFEPNKTDQSYDGFRVREETRDLRL